MQTPEITRASLKIHFRSHEKTITVLPEHFDQITKAINEHRQMVIIEDFQNIPFIIINISDISFAEPSLP